MGSCGFLPEFNIECWGIVYYFCTTAGVLLRYLFGKGPYKGEAVPWQYRTRTGQEVQKMTEIYRCLMLVTLPEIIQLTKIHYFHSPFQERKENIVN